MNTQKEGGKRSLLGWRENLPHILLLCALFLLLRPLAEVVDAPGAPLLTALVLPALAYPLTAVGVGIASGLAFWPNLRWPYIPYDWRHAVAYAGCALLGEAVGAAWRWARKNEGRTDSIHPSFPTNPL